MPDHEDTAMSRLTERHVYLMAYGCALAVSPIYFHQPLLPQMAAAFGASATRGNLIATVTQLGYALGLLLFVPLADRIQPRRLATTVVIGNAAALLLCAVAPSFSTLVAFSFIVGATAVTAQIIIPATSGLASPSRRGHTVGLLLGGLSTGVLLARTLSGAVGNHFGWRAMFALASAVDIALIAIAFRLPKAASLTPVRYRTLMWSLVTLVRTEPALRVSATTGFLTFGAFSAFWATLALLLAQPPYQFGPATVGAFGLVSVAGLLVSPRIGAMTDRIHPALISGVGALAVLAAFSLVAASAGHLAGLLTSMVLLDVGNRAAFVANQTRIYKLRPEASGRLNTVFMVSYFLGGAAGAALGGYGAHRGGWQGLATVGAAFALLAFGMSLYGVVCKRP